MTGRPVLVVALALVSLVSPPSTVLADDPTEASPPVGSVPVEARIAACPSPNRPTIATLVEYGQIASSQAQRYLNGRAPWMPELPFVPASARVAPLVAPLRVRAWVLERLHSRDGLDLYVAAATLRTFASTFRRDAALLAAAMRRAHAGHSDEVTLMLADVAAVDPDGLIDHLRPSLRSPSSEVVHAALVELSALDGATPGAKRAVARELANLVFSARPRVLRIEALRAWLGPSLPKPPGPARCGVERSSGEPSLMEPSSSLPPAITSTDAGQRLPTAASDWTAQVEVPPELDDAEDPCEVVALPIRREDEESSTLYLRSAKQTSNGWWVSYRVAMSPGRVYFVEGTTLAIPPWDEAALAIDVDGFADTRLGLLAFADDDDSTATTIHRLEAVNGEPRSTPLLSLAESVSAWWVFDGGRVFLRIGADVYELTGPAEAVALARITTPTTVGEKDPRGTRGEHR